ncbi:MAG TPA: aldo/keto reductase [Azospirillaceae bacterium]|nr:aldo/keto reductase [Azospirillaceae bacterium]
MTQLSIDPSPRALVEGAPAASAIGWGMWRYRGEDVAAARTLVETALESGITLFDTADVYGPDNGEPFGASEALLGRVLHEAPALRDRFLLASKGGIIPGVPYRSRNGALVEACEASLKRLGVETIDLYQIHRPDLLAHPADIAAQVDRLRAAGKIRAIGVSNHTPAQVAALQAHLTVPVASIQPEFSALSAGALFDGVLDQALQTGAAVLAWSPLAGGRLTGAAADPRAVAVAKALDVIAGHNGVSRAAAAYAWIMAHPSRPIPLVGSQTPARVREAQDALKVRMSDAEWYAVLAASLGAPLP